MDIKSLIKEKGYTIEKVADGMGIARSTLSLTLSKNPTVGTLRRIADVIGCKVGDFFIDEITEPDIPKASSVCPHCGQPISIQLSK